MPIVAGTGDLKQERSTVTLSMYAQVVGINECALRGVYRSDQEDYACRTIWLKQERDQISIYLAEAQHEIEAITGFRIGLQWETDERQPYKCPIVTRWGRVLSGGVEGRTTIQADAAITHNADVGGVAQPSTITVATSVTDVNEIRVFYPASLGVEGPVEIDPSDIDISGGVATIYIPRCRLVAPDVSDNPRAGLDYTVAANFLSVADVIRVYNDESTNAQLVWPHRCSSGGCCTCDEYTQDACIYVRDGRIGAVDVLPASYSGGAWTASSLSCKCSRPAYTVLNYYGGLDISSKEFTQARDAIIRLAHSKMPNEPCGCDITQRMWARDRKSNDILTRERINCPFGLSDGAWIAWRLTQAMKSYRQGVKL